MDRKLLLISAIAIALLACLAMPVLAQGTAPAYLYVANTNANTVTVIDLSNESVATTINMGSRIIDIAADPGGKYVYVACESGVRIIDTATDNVQNTGLSANPSAIVASPDGSGYFVLYGTTIDIVKAGTGDISSKLTPSSSKDVMAISPDGSKLCLGSTIFELITLYDIGKNGPYAPETDFGTCNALAYAPDNSYVYMSLTNGNVTALKVDIGLIKQDIPIGAVPQGLAVNPNSTTVYVAVPSKNNVVVISASSKTKLGNIAVGGSPQWVIFSKDGKRAYVSNAKDNSISVIDSSGLPDSIGTLVTTIPAGNGPAKMAIAAGPPIAVTPTTVPPTVTPTALPPTVTPTDVPTSTSTPTVMATPTPWPDVLATIACFGAMGIIARGKIKR
jgi:YVTN family beta-propeller protein